MGSFFDDAEDVESGEFKPFISNEYYEAEVTGAKVSLSNVSKERVEFEFTVVNNEDYKNRKLWRNYNLDPKSKGHLLADLVKYGIDGSAVESVEALATELQNLIGKQVKLKVILNEKKDKPGEFWTNAYLNSVEGVVLAGDTALKNHAPTLDSSEEINF